MSSPTTFHHFPSLPPEIRHKIYDYALNCPHVVQLYVKLIHHGTSLEPELYRLVALSSHAIHPLTGALNDVNPSISTLCPRPPALLSVNKESRASAQKLFTPAFHNRAFVNPAADTFYLQDTSSFRLVHSVPYRNNARTGTRIPARLARSKIASRMQYLALPLSSLFPDGRSHSRPEQTVKALSKMTELKEVLVVFHVKKDPPGSHQGVKFLDVSSGDFKGDVEGEIEPTRKFWDEEVDLATVRNAEFEVEHFLVLLGRERGNETGWEELVFKLVMARVPWNDDEDEELEEDVDTEDEEEEEEAPAPRGLIPETEGKTVVGRIVSVWPGFALMFQSFWV